MLLKQLRNFLKNEKLIMETSQVKFWKGEFGKDYSDRNTFDESEWDKKCIETWGLTKLQMNEACIGTLPKDAKVLEVGCNIGRDGAMLI